MSTETPPIAVAERTGPAGPGTLPITQIQPSPTNPRKSFDPEKLTQLAGTIKAQGFLQRLLVRPWPGKPNTFELVDGERRYRAAKQLGIDMLPVDVRPLTDAQVIEIQLVAGETSEPLTPLEEGEGFKTALALKDAKGQPVYTQRSLAEKLGCGYRHIGQRVELTRLPKDVREWVSTGALAPRTANLLARIPDAAAMTQAIQDIVFPKHREDPLPFKEAEAVIHERYMVGLRSAPFDVSDATFTGPEGKPLACSACPLKTGNDPERFGDVKDKNTCSNPGCYRAKCKESWDRAAAKAKAAGQRVLSDEETAEVFEKNSPTVQIAFSSPYVDVDSKPTYRHVPNEVEDKNLPTWRALITTAAEKKGIKVPIVLARDRTGKQWQLVQVTLAIEAARAIGEDMFKKTPAAEAMSSSARFERDSVRSAVRGTDDFAQKKKAAADEGKKRLAEGCLGLVSLHSALAKKLVAVPASSAAARDMLAVTDALLPTALHHAGRDGQALLVKAFGLPLGGGDFEHTDAIEAWCKKLPWAEKHAAIAVLLIAYDVKWKGIESEGFVELAKAVKLDVAGIQREAAAQVAAKGKAAPSTGSGPSAAERPKGRELEPGEVKELIEKYLGKPTHDIAYRFGISQGLAKWYVAQHGKPAAAPVTNFGLDEGKYIAAKTLLVAGKTPAQVAAQLKITLGQAEGVAYREKLGQQKKPKKEKPAKPTAEETEAKVRKMRQAGKTLFDIFIETKMPRAKLKKLLAKIDAEKGAKKP